MRKIRAMIGMPVVCNNRRIGRIIQAALSDDLTRMEGVWIDAGLRGTRFIPVDSIAMLGTIAIMTDDSGKRSRLKAEPLFRRAVGTDGRRLGAITGAEINELSFAVDALELSCGLWEDLILGRERIRSYTLNRENGDVIIEIAENSKEAKTHVEGTGKGTGNGRGHRRICSDDVRDYELADGKKDEHADPKDRPLAVDQDGRDGVKDVKR